MKNLKIALIHLNIRYKEPERNREELLKQAKDAAARGSGIIVAPEMSTSGYSFESREDIAPFVESPDGPTISAMSDLARETGVYICAGLPLKDDDSGIYYNSAAILNPGGELVLQYNKVTAEARWACPGDPSRDNTFMTPWGRVGVLICSDSYYSLASRITALRGADLILIPANWPPSGLDPVELWRARALENGVFVAGCNRTGKDLKMDCANASSCVADPAGRLLFQGGGEDGAIFEVELPLDRNERLSGVVRLERMADRRPEEYHDCYLNLRLIRDLTSWFNLPEPGPLEIVCPTPNPHEHPVDALDCAMNENEPSANKRFIIPPADSYSDRAVERMIDIAKRRKAGVLLCREQANGVSNFIFSSDGDFLNEIVDSSYMNNGRRFPVIDFGPARIAVLPADELLNPEKILICSKAGCDLTVAYGLTLSPEARLLAGARTLENVAVAMSARDGAGVWMFPDGHQRWTETLSGPGETCRYTLDTLRTREKRFNDQVDFKTLLMNGKAG